MNPDLIEELLNEEESATLDFKSAQYPFIGATDDEKGELLKDVIAFANAWRRTDAYILVGVKDVKGGRSDVIGITPDLDDASIQQFVNSKTNRNIEFSYKTVSVDDVKIGVFHIPLQERPFYLRKDFGKLKQNAPYIRRSSSTDIADLDEIAKMGAFKFNKYQDLNIPKLELQFFGTKDNLLLGNSIKTFSRILEYKESEIVPRHHGPYGTAGLTENRNFERELAKYTAITCLVNPVYFNLTNTGSTLARSARLEMRLLQTETAVLMFSEYDYPSRSQRRTDLVVPRIVRSQTTVKSFKYYRELSADFGNVQPKASSQSDVFYIGAAKPCDLKLEAAVYADNLPDPLIFPLSIKIETKNEKFDVMGLSGMK